MDNDRDIKFDIVIGHHSALSKFSKCLPFSKWLPKHGIKIGGKNSTLLVKYSFALQDPFLL
jgi:hypothetical protein